LLFATTNTSLLIFDASQANAAPLAEFRIDANARFTARYVGADGSEELYFCALNLVYIFRYAAGSGAVAQQFGGLAATWPVRLVRRLTVPDVTLLSDVALCPGGDKLYAVADERLSVYTRTSLDDATTWQAYAPAAARPGSSGVPAFVTASGVLLLSAGGAAMRGARRAVLVGGGGDTLLVTTRYGMLALGSLCNVPLRPPPTSAAPSLSSSTREPLSATLSDNALALDASPRPWLWPLVTGASVLLCCGALLLCAAPALICCWARRRQLVLSVDNRVLLDRRGANDDDDAEADRYDADDDVNSALLGNDLREDLRSLATQGRTKVGFCCF
jgi:hypothetical protein